MKVVSPNDTTHTITFIPRYYPTTGMELKLINEVTKVETIVVNSPSVSNGIVSMEFDFTFAERDKYNMIVSELDIVYRGDIFATSQAPQNFDITENYITY